MGSQLDPASLALFLVVFLPYILYGRALGLIVGGMARSVSRYLQTRANRKRGVIQSDIRNWQNFLEGEGIPTEELNSHVDGIAELARRAVDVSESVMLGYIGSFTLAFLLCAVLNLVVLFGFPSALAAPGDTQIVAGSLVTSVIILPLIWTCESACSMLGRWSGHRQLEIDPDAPGASHGQWSGHVSDYRHPMLTLPPIALIGAATLVTFAAIAGLVPPFSQASFTQGIASTPLIYLAALPALTIVAYLLLEGISLRVARMPRRVFSSQVTFSHAYDDYLRRTCIGNLYGTQVSLAGYLVILQSLLLVLAIAQVPLETWLVAPLIVVYAQALVISPIVRRIVKQTGRLGGRLSGWKSRPPVPLDAVPASSQ